MAPRFLLCCVALFSFCGLLSAGEPARSLREVLTPEVFKKAGLEKLSEEELSYLSSQLFGEAKPRKATAAAKDHKQGSPSEPVIASLPHGEAAFGLEEQLTVAVVKIQQVPKEVRSHIKGAFRGWSGGTVFVLENGQRWRQSEPGEFDVNLNSPEVVIRKGMMGAFYLNVAGYGSSVKVKRLE